MVLVWFYKFRSIAQFPSVAFKLKVNKFYIGVFPGFDYGVAWFFYAKNYAYVFFLNYVHYIGIIVQRKTSWDLSMLDVHFLYVRKKKGW